MRLGVAVTFLLAFAAGASGAPAGVWPAVLNSRDSYPADVSAVVERVWADPTLSRTVKGRVVHVPPDVYLAFLDTPDVTAAAARFRGFAKYAIRALDESHFLASDGAGARGSAEVLQRQQRRLVMLSRGEHTGPFLGTISGSALSVLDLEPRPYGVDPTLVVYVYIDNPLAASLARTLVPTFGFIADRKLAEGMSSSSRSLPEQRSDALLHLLGGDVFLVRRHPPEVPVGILELARAVAVELIRDGLEQPGALGHRPLDERVHVFDVEVDAHR
jgi:hypothetical protein